MNNITNNKIDKKESEKDGRTIIQSVYLERIKSNCLQFNKAQIRRHILKDSFTNLSI